MVRKIQIGSYILQLLNMIQIGLWVSGAYGRNGMIDLSNGAFFSLNTLFPFFIIVLSLTMAILSKKKILSIIIMLMCGIQAALFTLFIIAGILLFG